jgi:hypothetical protein
MRRRRGVVEGCSVTCRGECDMAPSRRTRDSCMAAPARDCSQEGPRAVRSRHQLQLAAIKQWSVYTLGSAAYWPEGTGAHRPCCRSARGRAVGSNEHIAPYRRRRRASYAPAIVWERRCAYDAFHTSHPRQTNNNPRLPD